MNRRKADPLIDGVIWIRVAIAAAIILMVLVLLARAQAQTSLPEITVSPPPQPPKSVLPPEQNGKGEGAAAGEAKDKDRALEQLNEQLKRKVDETNPVLNTPPLDARSPDIKTGVVNIPAVKQQYGKNFGNSVIPYRPPPPVFTPPLGSHR